MFHMEHAITLLEVHLDTAKNNKAVAEAEHRKADAAEIANQIVEIEDGIQILKIWKEARTPVRLLGVAGAGLEPATEGL